MVLLLAALAFAAVPAVSMVQDGSIVRVWCTVYRLRDVERMPARYSHADDADCMASTILLRNQIPLCWVVAWCQNW